MLKMSTLFTLSYIDRDCNRQGLLKDIENINKESNTDWMSVEFFFDRNGRGVPYLYIFLAFPLNKRIVITKR